MKSICLTLFLCLSISITNAQDKGREILEKAQEACEAIENGRYTLRHTMKNFSGTDTTTQTFKVTFVKDSALAYDAVMRMWSGDTLELYYDELGITYLDHKEKNGFYDSSTPDGTYFAPARFYDIVGSQPFVFELNKGTINYIKDTTFNARTCAKIEVFIQGSEDKSESNNFHFFYYINKENYLPVKVIWTVDLMEMQQYINDELLSIKTNIKGIETELSSFHVPEDYVIDDLDTIKAPELLDSATTAPTWTLPMHGGDSIRLVDLKGNVVLIDFFYSSCYPCMKALPGIQMLHEHFKGKEVVVMAIDPIDKDDKALKEFLEYRKITYPVALESKSVANDYHVRVYPTFYIIDKEGRVHKTYTGYTEGREEEIKEMVEQMLTE